MARNMSRIIIGIMFIRNAVIKDEDINYRLVLEISPSSMTRNLVDISFRRQATATNHINTSKGKIVVDPLVILCRKIISKQTDVDLKEYFSLDNSLDTLSLVTMLVF